MVKMTKSQGAKLARYAVWCRIERIVKRFINEGDDYLTVKLGGFEVKFDGTKGADGESAELESNRTNHTSSSGADANLIAEPKLYDALREAVVEMCHDCPHCGGFPEYKCKDADCLCFPNKWRAALAEAAGESEVREDLRGKQQHERKLKNVRSV